MIKEEGFAAIFGSARGHSSSLDEDHAALWDKNCERSGKLLVDSLIFLDEGSLTRIYALLNNTTSLHISWEDLSGHAFLEGGVFESNHPQAHRLLYALVSHYISLGACEKETYKLLNFLFKYKPNSWRGDEARKSRAAIGHEAVNLLLWEALSHGVTKPFCKSLMKKDWQLTTAINYVAKLAVEHQGDIVENMGFERDCSMGEADWAELFEECFAVGEDGRPSGLTIKQHAYSYFNRNATLPDGRRREGVRPWVLTREQDSIGGK